MKYNYKCVVAKNVKRYYKNVKGKWKRISNKIGEKAEKGKKKYRMREDGDEPLPEQQDKSLSLEQQIRSLSLGEENPTDISKEVIYIGLFLTDDSKEILKNWIKENNCPKILDREYMHHITVKYRPTNEEVDRYSRGYGKIYPFNILEYVSSDTCQGVRIETIKPNIPIRERILRGDPLEYIRPVTEHPHITISTGKDIPPKVTGKLLEDQKYKPKKARNPSVKIQELILTGRLGKMLKRKVDGVNVIDFSNHIAGEGSSGD